MNWQLFQSWLAQPVFSNTLQDYLIALAVGLWVWLILRAVIRIGISHLLRLAERTTSKYDDFAIRLVGRNLGPLVQLGIALYSATRSLALPPEVDKVLQIGFLVIASITVARILQDITVELVGRWTERTQPHTPTTTVMIRNLASVVRLILWTAAMLFILSNLGLNVTAFIAGLGVGGVAVALAVQHLLTDAVSSFAIFLDKPFEVGDFIIVGEQMGTVEYIGFKTTRLRSLSGEQLIFGNRDLEGSRIRNFKRMMERRIVFTLGVVYETPAEVLKKIPGMLKEIIVAQNLTRFDRSHFMSYGDFSLLFETVYFVLSPDHNIYMDIHQAINFRIKEEFERAGVEFAYPTQVSINRVDPESLAVLKAGGRSLKEV